MPLDMAAQEVVVGGHNILGRKDQQFTPATLADTTACSSSATWAASSSSPSNSSTAGSSPWKTSRII